MALTFADFLAQAMAQPILFVILVLIIGVTAVSGATDAPNAIATVVSTRCLKPNTAIGLAAVFNFVGLVGMTFSLHGRGEDHVRHGRLRQRNTDAALLALVAAMIGAIGWGIFCWFFGIPCFEIALPYRRHHRRRGGHERLGRASCTSEWVKVIYGMVFIPAGGLRASAGCSRKLIERVFETANRQAGQHRSSPPSRTCRARGAVVSARCAGRPEVHVHRHAGHRAFLRQLHARCGHGFPHVAHASLCSLAIIGLARWWAASSIIKSVGMDMVKLEKYQGVAANFSTVLHAAVRKPHRHAGLHGPLQHVRPSWAWAPAVPPSA